MKPGVPWGQLNCDGVFEGNKCAVKCNDASFFLNGPSQIFCKGGNWVDATGNIPTPKCQDIGEYSFDVIFERKTATQVDRLMPGSSLNYH
jgi:hypothetical protein